MGYGLSVKGVGLEWKVKKVSPGHVEFQAMMGLSPCPSGCVRQADRVL